MNFLSTGGSPQKNGVIYRFLDGHRLDMFVIIIGLIVIVAGRWDSIIYPLCINPDEAQAAANALRVKSFGLNWNSLDGTTVGPYNTLILCWPYLLGGDVTLSTGRLTACILLNLVSVFTYLSIRDVSGRLSALLFTVPLIIFYGLTDFYDYTHYSSELLPLAMLVVANYIAVHIYSGTKPFKPNLYQIIILGLALGAAPFSKLQASPIVVIIMLLSLYLLFNVQPSLRRRVIIAFVFSCLAPGLVLLLPLILTGNIHHFYNSYIVWSFIYIKKILTFVDLFKLIRSDELYSSFIFLVIVMGVFSLVSKLFLTDKGNSKSATLAVYSLAALAASAYSVSRPGNMFSHYLMFLLPFAVLVSGYSFRHSQFGKTYSVIFFLLYVTTAIPFVYGALNHAKTKMTRYSEWSEYGVPRGFIWQNPNVFSWFAKPSDKLLIWGWMPEWYLMGNLTPATRETHTNPELIKTSLTGYFRGRFLEDVNNSQPEIIIDAVAGKSFAFHDPVTEGISIFPELNTLFLSHYEALQQSSDQNGPCPRLYVNKQRKSELLKEVIEFKSISTSSVYPSEHDMFSGKKLDDKSVTEDSCVDYWLAGDGKPGAVDIMFHSDERVSKILILNTHNGKDLDRATKSLKIYLYLSGKIVAAKELNINLHPRWTEYILERPCIADAMRIEVLSYYGRGAGLNEIKAFREI